ncbi:MAG: porin [Acidobacteriaceae bacterium]
MISSQHAFLRLLGAAALGFAPAAIAQAPPSTEATPAAPTTAPAATPTAAPVWSVGGLDFSGYVDAYYSYDINRPSNAANGQANDLYNFNDKTDQFNLEAAKLTINHDPDPVGVHLDLIFGRTNALIHSTSEQSTDNYIEQAYISVKPPKTHGAELDFGQFVTSSGAEVIETMTNWNYSHSILFAFAIPYYHFGIRSSVPVNKDWAVGVQLVNGWNNVVNNNGGVTVGLTSAVTTPKVGWAVNYYTGPSNTDTQKGYRNLFDTTVTLTPTSKFSAYINYDYGQNRASFERSFTSQHWQGTALAAREQVSAKSAVAGRFEYYNDQGFTTGTSQKLKEFTATYEYKWLAGLLMRAEVRRDWSDKAFFHKGDAEIVNAQTTATVGLIAFFGPKR